MLKNKCVVQNNVFSIIKLQFVFLSVEEIGLADQNLINISFMSFIR